MIRRHPWWIASVVLLALLIGVSVTCANRQIVINTSDSMPHGLYVRTSGPVRVGCIVDFVIPPRAQPYIQQRTGNPGSQWYLLKPLVAGPGDEVDTTGNMLLVNGKAIGSIAARDAAGRPLPHWRERRRLRPEEFFAISVRVPNSFDSRYFGPVRRAQIAAVRRPLLTW